MFSNVCVDVCLWGFWFNSSIDSTKCITKLGWNGLARCFYLIPANVWIIPYCIYLELLTLSMPIPNAMRHVWWTVLDHWTWCYLFFPQHLPCYMWLISTVWCFCHSVFYSSLLGNKTLGALSRLHKMATSHINWREIARESELQAFLLLSANLTVYIEK